MGSTHRMNSGIDVIMMRNGYVFRPYLNMHTVRHVIVLLKYAILEDSLNMYVLKERVIFILDMDNYNGIMRKLLNILKQHTIRGT
jgi:hypothetical protein